MKVTLSIEEALVLLSETNISLTVPAGMKRCCRCKNIRPITDFSKNSATKDRLDKRCKICKKEIREANRKYNAEKSKEWREANPERFKEKRDAWMQAHPQSESETRKEWLRNNVAKVRQIKKTYKVRRKGWEVGEVDYVTILMRDGFVCHICGLDVEPDDVHFDHVIPLSRGGAHSNDNIHIAHSQCNIRKNTKLMSELPGTVTLKSG